MSVFVNGNIIKYWHMATLLLRLEYARHIAVTRHDMKRTKSIGLINHTPHLRIFLYFYFFCIFPFLLFFVKRINLAIKNGNNFMFAFVFS